MNWLMTQQPDVLRALPSVDEVLAHPQVSAWRAEHPFFPWTGFVRHVIDSVRAEVRAHGTRADRASLTERAIAVASEQLDRLKTGGLRPVLNGTGVVLHTNLGRAPIGERAARAAHEALVGYSSLEVDLQTGERSRRNDVLEELLCRATGAEAAMVVNNNAAAVYLAVNTLSPPGRVIVSRGELVEIGGSFRLPEILRHAAREVVEVGTTNRTYAADYEREAQAGDVLLKVHKSNYEIEGFAHEATIAELVAIARAKSAFAAFDLGSGALFDFSGRGLGHDPVAARLVESGVDLVTMSGDKLLGGVQAGIVLGAKQVVDRLKQNPLRRAVRIDKVAVAALQEVLRAYLFAAPADEIPAIAMLCEDPKRLRDRAQRAAARLSERVPARWAPTGADDEAAVGGGSLSGAALASAAVVITCRDAREAVQLARELRLRPVPLFVRVRGAEIRVNMTTIFPSQDDALTAALAEVLSARA
ncbi:MAG TPA: L-seryl-tRNA(Sec) selenium transferase [Candidatus Krumholzibacteria bacterium]|nr:L-seryl-tRNA(Sec) selenium transferase [Candidatus Krumholzibacteria bacterium]